MGQSLAYKLLAGRLVSGSIESGAEISIRIDQTLTQDATGTLVMLALEALGIDRVRTRSVQYVDHNLIQADHKNPDDHLFLESACRRFGLSYSRPGNGVSHALHMEMFGRPGDTLLGSDSHTCAAGALGMLAIGVGGLDVALAMAGHPFRLVTPEVWGIRLVGKLPEWVSAKDVILEMLRRYGVRGGRGRIIEYFGPGLACLEVMDRHVIANMGAELGATTSVFPSDGTTRAFLRARGREGDWRELRADDGATYDVADEIDLAALEPLIAKPSSPGNVVFVREVRGEPIYQAYVGSSANPGYRDFAISARMVEGRHVPPTVSFDVNPTSRALLEDLTRAGLVVSLLKAGARLHQAGCNGCIGMGQAPASGRNSLRTTPRNFPGRSGTLEDSVWLCSPETATASALMGRITDPRDLGIPFPEVRLRDEPASLRELVSIPDLAAPPVELVKGPNIGSMPELEPLPDALDARVLLRLGDDISTDEILPAGSRVLPYRSNIERIASFCFDAIDPEYPSRARELGGPHAIVAGENYGQGSSREHAALAPRTLGLSVVLAKSFSRIHHDNLVNFGVLPLVYEGALADQLVPGVRLRLEELWGRLESGLPIEVQLDSGAAHPLSHHLAPHQVRLLLAGGLINWARRQAGR